MLQKIKQYQLIEAYHAFNCSSWKDNILSLVDINESPSDDEIEIPYELIDKLSLQGSSAQIKYVHDLGIHLGEIDEYIKGHINSGLKVGDKVKVTRIADSYEKGWVNGWTPSMDEYVGEIFEIHDDDRMNGFGLDNHSSIVFQFPFFILEKIDE